MLLRDTIDKTKVLYHKTLRNFKSFMCGGYQRLPRSLSFNPFTTCSSSSSYRRTYTRRDQFYNEFYDHLQSDLSIIKRVDSDALPGSKEPPGEASCTGNFMSFAKQSEQKRKHEGRVKQKTKGSYQVGGKKKDLSHRHHKQNGGAQVLAQKMKELEMIDSSDVEQVLDIEEALHYYSRLTSPVYLGIVDKFFVDMHSEFSASQPCHYETIIKGKPSSSLNQVVDFSLPN